ncbi:MAG: hypothetical protein IJ047_00540 [Paludibacteraceae bacterium]|nr:hypothetical protein [Paludibacteraceae bacterium]
MKKSTSIMSDTIRHGVRAVPSIPGVLAVLLMTFAAVALSSCNVTRTITTESRYIHRNDTSIVIQSKTTETYDASKKL